MSSKNDPIPKEKNAQPAFQWPSEMIDHLILSLKDYKTEMDHSPPQSRYECLVKLRNTRSYYRKESAAFLPHELNEKVYTSRQFSKGKSIFDPMASFPRFICIHISLVAWQACT